MNWSLPRMATQSRDSSVFRADSGADVSWDILITSPRPMGGTPVWPRRPCRLVVSVQLSPARGDRSGDLVRPQRSTPVDPTLLGGPEVRKRKRRAGTSHQFPRCEGVLEAPERGAIGLPRIRPPGGLVDSFRRPARVKRRSGFPARRARGVGLESPT